MRAFSIIRRGVVGIAAVVTPFIALSCTVASIATRDPKIFLSLLGVTYLLIGALAWACVRVAHFSPRLAVFLTTLSFGALLLLAVPVRRDDNGVGFLIGLALLALAVFDAWWAAKHSLKHIPRVEEPEK